MITAHTVASPKPTLLFDEPAHTYTLVTTGGAAERLPSVTTILRTVGLINFVGVPEHVLEAARARGTRCHKAAQFLTEGTLDWSSVDEADKPYVEAYGRFLADAEFEVLAQEQRLYHPVYRYAGTTDAVGYWHGGPAVADLKTGDPHLVAAQFQLAAYEQCLRALPPLEWLDFDKATPITRVSVAVRKDGTYTAHPHRDASDHRTWMAALQVYRAIEAKGGLRP